MLVQILLNYNLLLVPLPHPVLPKSPLLLPLIFRVQLKKVNEKEMNPAGRETS
jgi:hypothetical protein